jgi:hypothetical protein
MMSEELAVAGLPPAEEEILEAEIAQLPEDNPVAAASGSGNREEGEVKFEGEDIEDVDADLKDLVASKRSKSLPPSFIFGESKVTMDLIREYEAAGFFPAGDSRAPLDEQIPTPKLGEIVVFRNFFTCGLRFPCDPLLPTILEKFSVKIHQLSPNSFLELSKFFWIMKTFRCNFSADVFARLFELVIAPDIIKLDDGLRYEAHYSCLKMATGTKYPRTRGYQTRWVRMRVWICARGHGRGYYPKPNGYLLTDSKIYYPHPQIC